MNNRSRSTLFLIEQLIVIAVFAICAAACISIMTTSYFYANDSRDLSNAVLAAENGAETYKAAAGDLDITARLLGGTTVQVGSAVPAVVYYDSSWQVCAAGNAEYIMSLTNHTESQSLPVKTGLLTVEKLTGETLVTFDVAVRRYEP